MTTKLKYYYCNKCGVSLVETLVKVSFFTQKKVHIFEINTNLVIEHEVIEEP